MSLVAGTRIGPYEILATIGAGGMGEVYHARDPRLERAVAIKILTPSPRAAPVELDRFQREARAIARITHPYICTIHDVGQQDGVAFLVMELLQGETLADRLARGVVPLESALVIAAQLAEALDAAHSNDVIHRDLKPSNVMLTAGGVKLLDFGLAKLRDAEYEDSVPKATNTFRLTDQGTVLGTLPYMAPEQVEGRGADARTDIFALGVLLYEMTTRRLPFEGKSSASLAAAILTHDPPPVSSLAAAAPESLDRIVKKCLAKDPDERWQSARDLASALQWSKDDETAQQLATRSIDGRRRRDWTWLAAALAVGAALAVLAIWALTGTTAWVQRQATVAEYRQVTYYRGVVSSARFTPEGRSFIYSASWEGQPYGVFLGRPESADGRNLGLQAGRILSISRAGDMAVLFASQNIQRSFGMRTLATVPLAGGSRRDLLDGIVDADWIPGTDRLAVIRDPGSNRLWTIEFPVGNTVHEARAAWSLRVSPDGSRVAFFEGPVLFGNQPDAIVTVVDRSGRKTTLSRNWAGIGLAWAPSGSEVWFTATHGNVADSAGATNGSRTGPPSLQAVSLSGAERSVHRAPDWLVLHDISADGRILLSRNTIRVSLACQPPGEERERDLSWLVSSLAGGLSSDGQMVIFADHLIGRTPAGNPTVFRRGMDGSAAVAIGEGNAGAVSPDGRWVLAWLKDSLILLPTGAGSMVTLPKGNLARVGAGSWLGDSKRIVFTGDLGDNKPRGYLQEIPDGIPRSITPHGVFLPGKAAARDEHSILGRSGDRWVLYPIDGGNGQPLPALTALDIPIQWSDDGRFLYIVERPELPPPAAFDVSRVELATGRRVLWKTLTPSDPVGVEDMRAATVITPDARSYCYSYQRRLGDLFVVEGLK
jgi:hypothetical protein